MSEVREATATECFMGRTCAYCSRVYTTDDDRVHHCDRLEGRRVADTDTCDEFDPA